MIIYKTPEFFLGRPTQAEKKLQPFEEDGHLMLPTSRSVAYYGSYILDDIYKWYDAAIGDSSVIDPEIVVAQFFLRDLAYVYNLKTNELTPYTASTNAAESLGKSPLKDIHSKNKQGQIAAYRVDYKVDIKTGKYAVKLVAQRKPNIITIGDYTVVPQIAIFRVINKLIKILETKPVVEITQGDKVRYVTQDKDLLADYTDDPNFAANLEPVISFLKAEMYLPVIGASSATSGVTAVRIHDIDQIRFFTTTKGLNITKSEGYFESIEFRGSVYSLVRYYFEVKERPDLLIKRYGLNRGTEDREGITQDLLLADSSLRERILKETRESFTSNAQVLRTFKTVTPVAIPSDNETMKENLKTGLYRVIYRRKNGSYGSELITNNKEILKKVYGPNYEGVLESENYRVKEFLREVRQGKDWAETARFYNLGESVAQAEDDESQGKWINSMVERVVNRSTDKVFTARRVNYVNEVSEMVGNFILSLDVTQILTLSEIH